MRSLRAMLTLGSNALSTHKATLAILSKNISNASTPGYSRERVDVEAQAFGLGAQAVSVSSLRDDTLQKAMLGASQEAGFSDGASGVLEIAEPFVNELDGTGMGAALDALFGSLQDVASNPSDLTQRQAVLDRARDLAIQIRSAASGLASARSAADASAAATVDQINTIAKQVAELNGQIRNVQSQGDPGHELVDQRDELLTILGQMADIEVVQGDDMVNVSLANGEPLVQGDGAWTLAATPGEPTTLTLTKDGATLDGPKAAGGKLGGILDARDNTLRKALDQLDATAEGLAQAMNDAHGLGYALDGATGRRLFDVSTGPGAALSLQLSADVDGHPEFLALASDPDLVPGDNAVAQTLLAVRDAAVVNGRTPAEGLDQVTATVAQSLQMAQTSFETASARVESYAGLRASQSGVSLQEEMVALTEAQRAFEAASRVLKTADELYDTVLQMV